MAGKLKQAYMKLCGGKAAGLVQFVKFGIVGLSNTAISYGVEMLCYYVLLKDADFTGIRRLLDGIGISAGADQVRVVIVTAAAFLISVANSYFWNSRYIFRQEGRRSPGQHAAAFLKMASSYALTGLILSPVLKILLVNTGTPYWLASLGSMAAAVPLNYLLNKRWAFGEKSPGEETGR